MGHPLTSRVPRKIFTPSQSRALLASHISDDNGTISSSDMISTATPNNSPRVLLGARHFSAVASAAIVFSILCLFILCYFLRERKGILRRNNTAVDKCDKSKFSSRKDGSCEGRLKEEESSTCKDKEKLGSDVIDVESQMASSNGVIELVTESMPTRIVSSFSASSNKFIPKEPTVSTTRSCKNMPNSPGPSSSSFCQSVGHDLNSHSGQQSVEGMDRPSSQFSSYQSSLSKFLESLGTFSSLFSFDARSNGANRETNKETKDNSSSVSSQSSNAVSAHGSKSEVRESESTSNHGQTLQIDNQMSLQCSVETKDMPSSQFPSSVSDQVGGDIHSTWFGSDQRNSDSHRIMKQEIITHSLSQPRQSISSSSMSRQNSVRKIPDNDFSTSKSLSNINQLEHLSSLKSSSAIAAQEPLPSKDHSQLSSHGKDSLVNPHTVSSKNSAAKSQKKVSPTKDNPQGSIYFSQSSNILSPHDSNDGIDELKSLSTSEYQSQSGHIQDSASIVSDSEETWDKPSIRFPSYASYQSMLIALVRSLDAISSLFTFQQNRSGGSQDLNNVARSSSATRSQQNSAGRMRNHDFPTHKSQSGTKQFDTLSSLQSSSIIALEPLTDKDHSQLFSHDTENLVDPHPVISMTRLGKTGSSATASSKNNVTKSDIKPTTSKDNPQGSTQGADSTVSNRPVALASLCRQSHDSSATAATTNEKKIGSTIITNVATESSNCHSEIPLQSIKSNSHNPETLQASLCKQNSSTVESGTKTVSNNAMGVLVASSGRDAQGSMKKIGIPSANSSGFATIHDSSTAVCNKKSTSGRILDDSQGVNNRITLSSMSSGTSSSRSDFSSTSSEESEVATKAEEKFSFAFLRDLRPRVTSSGVELSQNCETSRASSAFHERSNRGNYSPKSCSARSNSSSSSGSFDVSQELSTKSVAEVTESSVSDTSLENLVPYGCVYDSFTNAFIKSTSASTNDQPQSPVSAEEYPTSRIPLIFSENYSSDDSFAAAYIKSLSACSNDYSLGPPSVLKIPSTSVKRNHGFSGIVSYKNSVSREFFDLLSGLKSQVTGDGVEVVGKSEVGASSTFASRHTISHSTCSKKCPGLPLQALGSSTAGSKLSRTACDSEKSPSSAIEVSASWLRGNETSSNLSHDESVNSSCNSTICKRESELSGNSSTCTADLQADGGQMGLCFLSSTIPYSASTASHETDGETC